MCEVLSCQHSVYLTDIRRNDSAGFGLCVERVPVAISVFDIHDKMIYDGVHQFACVAKRISLSLVHILLVHPCVTTRLVVVI
jgi:hypothetical protein